MSQNGCCLYCKCAFLRSPYRPQQTVCSRPECQRRRRADYHRRKLEADPEYRQIAHDSQKKWREAHPDYLPHYRAEHPEAVERNRERQQRRDQKRRIRRLEKNNLALDLKHSAAEVWMLGPRIANLEKNNLASMQVFIFDQLGAGRPRTVDCQIVFGTRRIEIPAKLFDDLPYRGGINS